MKDFTKIIFTLMFSFTLTLASFGQGNRAIDGYGNNPLNPEWGAVGTNQLHPGTIGYADGVAEPAGPDRPNPRYISNMLFSQNTLSNDPRGLSAYCWAWGQFIDHDITLVKDHPSETLPISVPPGDMFFDPAGTGSVTIPMQRSDYDPLTGTDVGNPRQFVNSITSFIDASAVYGSDEERAAWLRTFSGGKLRTSAGNLLPWNTTTGEYADPVNLAAPEMAMPLPFVQKWFVAGDVRANENPFLTGMHTLFVREHNRLCEELKTAYPNWSDEQLYQYARKLVGGQMQAIVFEEWLPAMGMDVPPYNGYNLETDPGIMNVFSAAAYRYGHTTINSLLVRMDNLGNDLPQGDILLRDAFFNPSATTQAGGIEPYLIGMATVVQQDFDCKVIDDLRNFLFGPPGAGGLDLAAINIQRGRDRGLADYNTVRTDFGLEPVAAFGEMTSDMLMNQSLEFAYGEMDNIDPWVGMLAENHMPDALFGKTAMTIIEQQFMAIRDGDRFYYENDPGISLDEKTWIKETRLADIIRRNTPATIVQDEIFIAQPLVTGTDETPNELLSISLYPNPASEMIYLKVPSPARQDGIITVTDLQGHTMLQQEVALSRGTNTLELALPAHCPTGLYVLSLRTGGSAAHQRFFKQG